MYCTTTAKTIMSTLKRTINLNPEWLQLHYYFFVCTRGVECSRIAIPLCTAAIIVATGAITLYQSLETISVLQQCSRNHRFLSHAMNVKRRIRTMPSSTEQYSQNTQTLG